MVAVATGSRPHLVASAVVLDPGGLHTLLVRSPDQHRWTLIAGHCTGGEPIAEAAKREIRSQAALPGVRVVEPHLGIQQDLTDCGTGITRHIDHVFLAVSDRVEPDASGDGSRRWFAVADLPVPLAPGVGLHIRSAVRALDRH